MNIPTNKQRFLSLFFDYLIILVYLIILFGITFSFYYLVFGKLPELTELQSQLIALLTSIVPVTIFCTYREAKKPYATPGKKKVGLIVIYDKNPVISSLIRNFLKFLPWQLAHFSIIRGMFEGFESTTVLITYILSISLLIIYILMALIRKDHRHIPDLVSKSKVMYVEKN